MKDERLIEMVLKKSIINIEDLQVLLGKCSDETLEKMAQRANEESIRYHGRVIQLFTPLYLGNYCENQCVYCAFNKTYQVKRKKMDLYGVEAVCQNIASTYLDELLLLTGESRKHTGVTYIGDCVEVASHHFNSVGIEVYPLESHEYRYLISRGCSSLTIYQETYNQRRYDELHLKGPKKDYWYRYKAPARAARAGMNKIQIGALLGLSDPLEDAMATGRHLDVLMKNHPEVAWGLSLPRLKEIENGDFLGHPVSDRLYVQILLAIRLVFPKITISVSTRESTQFRRNLIPLGINKLSAGVTTSVGRDRDETKQFEISDHSSIEEVKTMVKESGYQVVFRNWVMT